MVVNAWTDVFMKNTIYKLGRNRNMSELAFCNIYVHPLYFISLFEPLRQVMKLKAI